MFLIFTNFENVDKTLILSSRSNTNDIDKNNIFKENH